jgi:GDP-L-fucose synthase
MKKILILGGYGFLGKNLSKIFLNNDNYQISLESRRTGCDILDLTQLKEKIQNISPDIIINAAANVGSMHYVNTYSADVCHDNTLMYINIFKAIKETNPNIILINPISNCSYPGVIDIQHEEKWWDGPVHHSVESYGNPKKIGFILSECYRKQYGVKTINLIIPNAYGPLDYTDENKTHALNGLILRMIQSQKNNNSEFVVWGSGSPTREWIYMEDVAHIIKEIIDDSKYDLPNPLNIGQEYGVSINDSVNTIKEILNFDVKINHDLSKQDGAPIKILGKNKFDYYFPNFKFTPYNKGIENTINYYKNIL